MKVVMKTPARQVERQRKNMSQYHRWNKQKETGTRFEQVMRETMENSYFYYCTQRPPIPGSVPKAGLIGTLTSDKILRGREVYAVVEYDRRLTADEISDYELTSVEEG